MQIKTVLVCFLLLDNNSNISRFWQFYFILDSLCFFFLFTTSFGRFCREMD